MKTKIIQNIKIIILALLVAVGVGYASAEWNTAPADGPTNAATNNAPAPINVGPLFQTKVGPLSGIGMPNLIVSKSFQFATGTPIANQSVLVALDASGNVGWKNAGGSGSGTADAYQVECHFYNNGYCFRLNKNTGAIVMATSLGSSYTGTINWAGATTFSSLPVFGTAPYTMTLDHVNTNLTILCLTDYSGTTKCVSGNPL